MPIIGPAAFWAYKQKRPTSRSEYGGFPKNAVKSPSASQIRGWPFDSQASYPSCHSSSSSTIEYPPERGPVLLRGPVNPSQSVPTCRRHHAAKPPHHAQKSSNPFVSIFIATCRSASLCNSAITAGSKSSASPFQEFQSSNNFAGITLQASLDIATISGIRLRPMPLAALASAAAMGWSLAH